MRTKLSVAVLALAVASAACADSPAGVSPDAGEAGFEGGGWTIGSGGRADTTAVQGTTSAAGGPACATEDGGWTIGSGGATQLPSRCEGR